MHIEQLTENGFLSPDRLAVQLSMTRDAIAWAAGLDRQDLEGDRLRAPEVQGRLSAMTEVLCRVAPRFASPRLARAWYVSEALPGFNGLTAMQMVRAGRAEAVMDCLDALEAGVHA